MTNNIFEDFDKEGQTLLQGMKFLDFEEVNSGKVGNLDPFEGLRTNKSFEELSAFNNSPFGQYWNVNIHQWAKPMFGSAKILDKKNIVIADKSSKISHNQADLYTSLINDKTSKYNYVVYAHPDGEQVIKMYDDPNNIPDKEKPFEVLVFIETDDGKFDFGKIVRVKFGSAVIDDLKDKYLNELPWNDNDPEDIAEEFIKRAFSNSISNETKNAVDSERNSDDFEELLIKAIQYEYDNKKFDDFSWFIILLKGTEFVSLNLPDQFFSLGKWFRERKYIEDKYWNGDLPEKEYTPAFLPNTLFYDKKEDREKAIKDFFRTPFNALRDKVKENISNEDPISKKLRQIINQNIDDCQKISDGFVENALSKIYIPDGDFQTFIKHYHAFELGLYNGILELIASICDLIAIFVLMCRDELGFRMSDVIVEKFENFTNDLFYNTIETFKKIWAKAVEIFNDFVIWYIQFSEYDGKSYKVLKEIGELLPDIITFIIPFLKGSKAAKLAKATEEIAALAEKEVAEKVAIELSEAEAKKIAQTAKEALEKGTAAEAVKEAVEKVEEKIATQNPTQLEEVVVEGKKKVGLLEYEKVGLLKTVVKTYKGLKYEILVYSDRISLKVANSKFIWDNHARLYGGELYFDLNTYGVKGLGQQWTDDVFEIFNSRIKSIKVEWKQLPQYPEGSSLGYKQFYKVYDETYDIGKAVKSTTFYETMSKKGFDNIHDVYEANNRVIVILKNL
jgi:hypothetical protein